MPGVSPLEIGGTLLRQVEGSQIMGDQRIGAWGDEYDPYDEQEVDSKRIDTTE